MNITFYEACKSYLDFVKLKDKSSSYRSIANRVNNYIVPYFKNKTVSELTAIEYLNWQKQIENLNFKFRYKKTLHVCFVTFLNHCIRFYDLNRNVASIVGNFKNNDVEESGKIWTITDFNKFISIVDNKTFNIFFKFLFFTGTRLGEATGITFNNIDFENNTINICDNMTRFVVNGKRVITTPKTKKSIRIISIDNLLKNEILELKKYYTLKYKNFNNNFYIFGGLKPLSPTTITRNKNNYCKVADVEQIKLHEFRHSHACLLFNNSVPIDEISYRLGHANISMTMDVYLKYLPKNEKRVINTLNYLRLVNG